MAIGLLNLDEDFFKRQQGTASDMNALRDVVGAVGERMAEKRGLQQQAPQLVQPQQNRMVPIVEQEPNPLLVVNPGPRGIISEPGRQYRPMDMLEMVNAGREDIIAQGTTYPQGQTTMFNAGQVSAPIYEMDTSGIAPIAPEVQAIKAVENEENRSGSGNEQSTFLKRLYANLKDDPRAASTFFADAAMAFNTLRLKPDAGLNTAMQARIKSNTDLRKLNKTADYFSSMGTVAGTEAANWITAGGDPKEAMKIYREGKTSAQIVSFLENSDDYKDYAAIAKENPAMAEKIYEQIIQKELGITAKTNTSGVQTNSQDEMFVVQSQPDGTTKVVPLLDSEGIQIKGRNQAALIEAELALKRYDKDVQKGIDMAQDAMTQTYAIEGNLAIYREALDAYEDGAKSGFVQNQFLPAFNDATSRLRQAAISLGIQAINEATFGALSEKELQLVLSKGLDLNLKGPELQKHIIRKIDALEKLKVEVSRRAAELQSMPYTEYIKKQNEVIQENMKYLKKPEGVAREVWAMFNASQRKEYYLAGDK